jgi:hypothetical protein
MLRKRGDLAGKEGMFKQAENRIYIEISIDSEEKRTLQKIRHESS